MFIDFKPVWYDSLCSLIDLSSEGSRTTRPQPNGPLQLSPSLKLSPI